MSIIWEHGPQTVAEVRGHLADDLAHTTVITMLRILEEKGHVIHQQEGKAHRFHAVTARETVTTTALRRLIDRLFNGSETLLLAHLAGDERMDPAQAQALRQLVKRSNREGDDTPRRRRKS